MRSLLWVVAILVAGLLLYSQTRAFTWDEGFHLLAAQLIASGKRPYLDFCFPQTPLNAYFNAGWIRIFGESWRLAHALAALLSAGSILLIADFVYARLGLVAALGAAVMIGLNSSIVEYGTIGQAYGLCLFLIAAAFRLTIIAVDRDAVWWPAAAGFLASAAAGSSLLTAPVAPVLIVWILVYNRTGVRWQKFAAFVFGAIIPMLPLLWLFVEAPRQVFFNLIEYHLRYRSVEWEGATGHDIGVLFSWINSPQALPMGLLALSGLIFTIQNRREVYLCFWLAITLALQASTAHPTFERYFLLTIPFLAMLASAGLHAISKQNLWPAFALTALFSIGLAISLYDRRDVYTWEDMQRVANEVEKVTLPAAPLLADEHVYFLTQHPPPSGMEFEYAQKLNLPPALAASLHIVPRAEFTQRLQSGGFNTVQTCKDEGQDSLLSLSVPSRYRQKAEIDDCTVYWDPR